MGSTFDEADVTARAFAGDRLALGELFLAHAPALSRRIEADLPADVRAAVGVDDVLQEVFLEGYANISQLRSANAGSLAAWLGRIAQRQTLDAIRRHRAQKRRGIEPRTVVSTDSLNSLLNLLDLVPADGDTPSRPLTREETQLAVQVGLAALPRVQRDAVRCYHLEGRTLEETATRLGRTASAIRGLLHRAKCSLRQSLGNSSRWFHSK